MINSGSSAKKTITNLAVLWIEAKADDVATTLPTVFATVAEVANIQGSTPHLQNNPALKAAAAQAPNCQTLKRSA